MKISKNHFLKNWLEIDFGGVYGLSKYRKYKFRKAEPEKETDIDFS